MSLGYINPDYKTHNQFSMETNENGSFAEYFTFFRMIYPFPVWIIIRNESLKKIINSLISAGKYWFILNRSITIAGKQVLLRTQNQNCPMSWGLYS